MTTEEQHIFSKLKLAIAAKFLENNSASERIEDWKGEEIISFQEDLFDNVKARVSEKWFYTYMKNNAEKLPRIDMLNLLCTYVGYQNWNDFKSQHQTPPTSKKKKVLSKYLWLLLLIPGILLAFSMITTKNNYEFCFFDSIKNEPIKDVILNIKILKTNESPIHEVSDSLGCFKFSSSEKELRFIVESPYYKTDTIVRQFNSNENRIIKLEADDYALMLNYYVNKNITAWKEHREKLSEIFSDDAIIYQLYKQSNTVEIYTKQEFIQKLTIPTRSLRGMEILEKVVVDGKITKLKFTIK
ncbi:hypothetical protein [Winogradskyella tangerina]|uniref:hypothetical protein n=1 Tax=Winogradskyella tangerina TaxID=2023240 RepID=UPI000DBE916F|nr:hypothetical protein [Winogradskyella tangerina]